jgi:hypothetical protein
VPVPNVRLHSDPTAVKLCGKPSLIFPESALLVPDIVWRKAAILRSARLVSSDHEQGYRPGLSNAPAARAGPDSDRRGFVPVRVSALRRQGQDSEERCLLRNLKG